MGKLSSIQALRFVAAAMVMAAHLIPGADWIGQYGVDIFFVISGFVMVYASQNLFAAPDASRSFLWKRITRIVPLYWLMTAVMIATWPRYSWSHILTSLLFIPADIPGAIDPMQPVLTVGWTLNIEMFFYVVFAFWVRFRRPIAVPGAQFTLITLAIIGITFHPVSAIGSYWTSPKLLEFVLGCILANTYRDGLPLPQLIDPRSITARIANVLGDSSYALYLSHVYVSFVVVGDHSIAIKMMGCVVAAIVIHFLIEKPLTTAIRVLPMKQVLIVRSPGAVSHAPASDLLLQKSAAQD